MAGGAELAFVMNGARDPYLALYTAEDGTVTYHGRNDADSGVFPAGSYGRVVASGVKTTHIGAAQDRGGMLHHFSYARDNSTLAGLGAFAKWGDLLKNLGSAVSRAPLSASPSVVDSPEITFCEIKPQALTLLDAGIPGPEANLSLMRFAYTGPKTGVVLLFEVSEVVEYFHITHEAFARPVLSIAGGDTTQRALNHALSAPGSNATVASSPGFLQRVAGAIEGVTGAVQATAGLVETVGKLFGRSTASSVVIEEVAEAAPLLL
jgi:hypothetical protein